ncbi:unnamed protein product [Lymnaea stagnalis]|uniref:C-type lectin domain-containing protein n=1 Tax=Lymnaea stagnalis TaxID=6523 RepID=A0AAV2IG55_LYMST
MYVHVVAKLVLLSLTSAVSGIQFSVQPTTIEIGLTPRLDVRCSLSHGVDTELASLVSLFISRSPDTDTLNFQEIASINTFSGNVSNVLHSGAAVSGFINNAGQSSLSMHWTYPSLQEAGIYKCVANGVDGAGHSLSVASSSVVAIEQPSMSQVVDELRKMKLNIDNALANSCISGCWHSRLEQMKKARFEISSLYQGHRYLLSLNDNGLSAWSAEESCELYGGYLAEVDDDPELQFMQGFIRAHSTAGHKMVLIGGRHTTGGWAFSRSGQPLTFTKWSHGMPDGKFNCLYLWSGSGWLMYDLACLLVDVTYYPRYLCEVPEV